MSKTGNDNSILGDVGKKKPARNANAMFAGIKKENSLNLKNRNTNVVIEIESESDESINDLSIEKTGEVSTEGSAEISTEGSAEISTEESAEISTEESVEISQESENKLLESENKSEFIYELDPNQLVPFRDEKLRLDLHTGDAYERLKESVSQNGIVNPIIVMEIDGDSEHYEIIAGHNRAYVCKELGIKVPSIIKRGISLEEANKICIDTNLLNRQRSEFKPSQFAYLLKVRFEKEKHQGVASGGDSGSKIGAQYSLDRVTIYRYIKLNSLTEMAKEAVDNNKITFRVAYELAFLPEVLQDFIVSNIDKYKVNESVIRQLKQHIQQTSSTDDPEELLKYVQFYLPTKKVGKRQFDYRNIKPYIPANVSDDELESYVIKALEFYNKLQED